MPETPSGSGYYVSTVAIPHDTYKIYVDGAASGEEVTVQPGRAIIGSQGDESTVSPKSLDRIINNKVTLSMFVADTSPAPTNDNFVSAINFAITNNKTLVIDYPDFAPTIDTSVSGVLILDLNGNTIDFETNGASLTATMLVVKNGTVKLKTGGKTLIGNAKLNVTDVYLSGDTESQVTAVATDSYTGCRGISALGFSRVSGSYDYTVPRVSGGDSAFDVASIVLGDYDTSASGSASGDARRVNLQQTIDEELKRLHYLVGKESSDTPYEHGFFSDPTLSSISSLCRISQSLVSINSFSSSSAEVISVPLVEEIQLANNPSGITLYTFSKDDDGLYEVWANVQLGFRHHVASGTSGTSQARSCFIFMNTSESIDIDSAAEANALVPIVQIGGSGDIDDLSYNNITINLDNHPVRLISIPRQEVRFSRSSPITLYLRLSYTFHGDSDYPDRARLSYFAKIFLKKIGN